MSTPVMAALAAGTILLGVPVLIAAGVVDAGARAAIAADAAALAGADAMFGVTAAEAASCALAEELAAWHGANLESCSADEGTFEVRVRVSVRAGVTSVSRQARAGPPSLPPTRFEPRALT